MWTKNSEGKGVGQPAAFVYTCIVMNMPFYKLAVAWTDIVLVNGLSLEWVPQPSPEQIIRICSRRGGIGADGLALLLPGSEGRMLLRYFSGTTGEGAVNYGAILGIAKFAFDFGLFHHQRLQLQLQTPSWEGGLTVDSVDSHIFRLDVGIPVDGTGRQIDEETPLVQELWSSGQGKGIGYTTMAFRQSGLTSTGINLLLSEAEEQVLYRFSSRIIEKGGALPALLCSAPDNATLEVDFYPPGGSHDAVLEAAAALVGCACQGVVLREVRIPSRWGDLFINWEGDGNVSVSALPAYLYTGEYADLFGEDDDGSIA